MHFPRSPVLFLVFSSLLNVIIAQQNDTLQQNLISPTTGDVLIPGTNFTITWQFSTVFQNVSLELWDNTFWGYSRDFGIDRCHYSFSSFCGTIASSVPNTGSFVWNIPVPNNDKYPRNQSVFWIKMYVDDFYHPEVDNTLPVVSYSQNFSFADAFGDGTNGGNGVRPSPINQSFGATLTSIASDVPMATGTSQPQMVTVTVGAATGGSTTASSATVAAATASATSEGCWLEVGRRLLFGNAVLLFLLLML